MSAPEATNKRWADEADPQPEPKPKKKPDRSKSNQESYEFQRLAMTTAKGRPMSSTMRTRKSIGRIDNLLDETDDVVRGTDQKTRHVVAELSTVMREFSTLRTIEKEQRKEIGKISNALEKVYKKTLLVQQLTGGLNQMVWRVDKFRDKMQSAAKGENTILFSPSFRTHKYGYEMAMSLCPLGDGSAKGEAMSIFFCLLKGDYDEMLFWPFAARIRFTLIDMCPEDENRNDITKALNVTPNKSNIKHLNRPITRRNPSLGIIHFATLNEVFADGRHYVNRDCIYIKATVDLTDIAAI